MKKFFFMKIFTHKFFLDPCKHILDPRKIITDPHKFITNPHKDNFDPPRHEHTRPTSKYYKPMRPTRARNPCNLVHSIESNGKFNLKHSVTVS